MRTARILIGDVRKRLAELQESSVQCCVTSPPYWGLRDYGTGEWEGGDAACEHKGRAKPQQDTTGSGIDKGRFASTRGTQPGKCAYVVPVREVCRCGARRVDEQIGLETTPAGYVAAMVDVFREVRRVLREDGTLWLNLGDCYAGSWGAQSREHAGKHAPNVSALSANQVKAAQKRTGTGSSGRTPGIKPKDLVGIPWEVAFALRADGWYLRSFMPWLKRNGMPESTKDRPTTVVESLFLLTKSPDYYYDADAVIKVGAVAAGTRAAKGSNVRSDLKDVNGRPPEYWEYTGTRLRRAGDWFFESLQGLIGDDAGNPLAFVVNTKPFDGPHFAVMPEALAEPCILAGTSARGQCPECGSPWLRIVETPDFTEQPKRQTSKDAHLRNGDRTSAGSAWQKWRSENPDKTLGWEPSCECGIDDTVPQTVLDPFIGAGTTAVVALRHDRDCIGIDLSLDNVAMAEARIRNDAVLFNSVEVSA